MANSGTSGYAARQAILRDFALFYAERGFYVFRLWGITTRDGMPTGCACGFTIPDLSTLAPGTDPLRVHPYGKHPVAIGWQAEATVDPAKIDRMWPATPIGPLAVPYNLGVACEPSRVALLDIDTHGGVDGFATFRALEAKLKLSLTDTWVIRTGSGGHHAVLDIGPFGPYPAFVGNLAKLLGPGVDIRQAGNLFVGAGSLHITGHAYEPVNSEDGIDPRECHRDDPRRARPMPMPLALHDYLHKAKAPHSKMEGHVLDTVLGWIAERLGLVRAVLDDHRVAIDCPFTRDGRYPFPGGHSCLDSSPTAAILWAASPGNRLGGLSCAHGKCTNRTPADLLARFRAIDPDAIAAADAALDKAGIEPLSTTRRPATSASMPMPPGTPATSYDGLLEASVSQETLDAGPPADTDPSTNGAGPPETLRGPDCDIQSLMAAGVQFKTKVDKHKHIHHTLVKSASNLALFFQHHPGFGPAAFRLDTMSMQVIADITLPHLSPMLCWPAPSAIFEDHHLTVLGQYLELRWATGDLGLTKGGTLPIAVHALAGQHAFNPLTDYLRALPPWDGTPRLSTWIDRIVGNPDPIAGRMGELFILQAVKRGLAPGFKADGIAIFEGEQGIGKDKLIAAMSPFPIVTLQRDVGGKDGEMATRRARAGWLVLLAEMATVIRTDREDMKAFTTYTHDTIRTYYSERHPTYPRHYVFVGTTNMSDYLSDPTGNRRFWPIRCPQRAPDEIPIERFVAERDQLYAEAITRLDDGEAWWPTPLEVQAFGAIAAERVNVHPFEDTIRAQLDATDLRAVTTQIVWDWLGIAVERRTARDASIIRSIFVHRLGWLYSNHIGRKGLGTGVRGYHHPDVHASDYTPPDAPAERPWSRW